MKQQDVPSIVQKMETDYIRGSTKTSKYVSFSMNETIETIYAYLNSIPISGEKDSQGRDKPFFNIVISAANIWFRATDIDRKHIRVATRSEKNWVNSFFLNAVLQDWMRRTNFGQTLNEWGRVLSRFGSAVFKFIEKDGELFIKVIPWNTLIVDSISFEQNPEIELLQLTEYELRKRITTHGYDKDAVESLITAKTARETVDKQTVDNKNDYYKLYEIHGNFPRSLRTNNAAEETIFEQQMWIISFVAGNTKDGKKDETFVIFKGTEKEDPYMITHLIREDERTLARGAVEYLFHAQWMQNHSIKAIKDHLDIASLLLLQTADTTFVGRNALTQLQQGDILVHAPNMPLTQVHNASHDTGAWQNFSIAWRDLGREVVNISEAMLGDTPKSGTAWRQTEAVLSESYSLFEVMTENKALYLEQMLRERIIPFIIRKYNTNEEIAAVFEKQDITRIDRMFIKNEAIRRTNKEIFDTLEKALKNETDEFVINQDALTLQNEQGIEEELQQFGNQRFLKPSEVSWKKQFEGIEWDVDIDITDESRDLKQMLTTLNTALSLVIDPRFEQNPKAQAIVGRILEMTGAMSPVEYAAIPSPPPQVGASSGVPVPTNA